MNKQLVAVAAVALGSSLVGAQPAMKKAPEPAATVDNAAIAEKVVSVSANVKEGEIVQIMGAPTDVPLLEELALAVRKRGAFPFITIFSDSLAKKINETAPAKYDAQAPKLALELNKIVNVRISLPAVRDPNSWTMLTPERRAARAKAEAPLEPLARKRNIRSVDLDNGMYPSPAHVRDLGVSAPELTKLFWDGVSADYTAVEAKCTALKTALAAGKELKITHTNGTDLTVNIKRKKVHTSDGVTTDAEIKAGGPSVQVWLPAGEVYLTPGASDGKVVDDRFLDDGKVIYGITIDVKGGKSTAVTAKSGWEAIKGRYDLAGPGKTELSIIDFGCNPAIKTAGNLETFVGAGMLTIVFGGNVWAGGTNKEPFGMALHLPGTTVTLDGTVIVDKGQLK